MTPITYGWKTSPKEATSASTAKERRAEEGKKERRCKTLHQDQYAVETYIQLTVAH